jgi:AmmeMemoRadiSam system protein B
MVSSDLVRTPDFAGSWYPSQEAAVRRQIDEFRSQARAQEPHPSPLRGGIVPHAGWMFSGRIAYEVLWAIERSGCAPAVIAIFGKHMSPRSRPTLMRRGAWRTPLGDLPIAEELAAALGERFDFEEETAIRYEPDNTIELQLPFLKALFPDAAILPVGAPPCDDSLELGRAVAELALERGMSLCAVGSTDLTHYGPNYGFAPQGDGEAAERWVREENDHTLIGRLLSLDVAKAVEHARANRSACCVGAAAAAAAAARALGATGGTLLSYATSNDVRPGGASFVGYAGIVFA